jgi:hypothetical protein
MSRMSRIKPGLCMTAGFGFVVNPDYPEHPVNSFLILGGHHVFQER